MNDYNQIKDHIKQPNVGVDFECEIIETDDGYSASCPSCPWTSGVKEFKGLTKLAYYRHLDFVVNNTRKD